LVDGQTITASIEALALAIASATFERVIERLTVDADAGVAHTLPGSRTYTPGLMSGSGLMVLYWRGTLRDPGSVGTFDDYSESSTTTFTPFSRIKTDDHINYFLY
jgi:hypothetical protein